MSLLAELKRRKVFKVGGAYLVIAWLAVQVASIAFPAFEAPPWVLRVFILILMLGFPLTLVLAWALDVTPEGLRLESAPIGNKRMFAIAGAFAALALVWYFIGQPAVRNGGETVATATTPAAAPTTPAPATALDKSIAVLAFTDLSPDKDQEYFSDGISEEILNALVKVKDLRVAGRTSSFYYKGRSEDLRSIGKALGVAHILEGSVRKQGDKVRITAQLIRSDDGFHLWSETYPGELSDVFELQERIARAITGELKVILQGAQNTRLVPVATTNPEAYALYLQATAVLHQRDYAAMGPAIGWLERALQLDPAFARAQARLALMHVVGEPRYGASRTESARHARRAIELDPGFAEPYYVLGNLKRDKRQFVEARVWLDRALALEPDDASVNMYYAQWLIVTGYVQLGIERFDRTLAIDPMLPNALNWRGYQYLFAGDLDTAQRMFDRADALGLSLARGALAELARARGDFERARALAQPYHLERADCLKDPSSSVSRLLRGIYGGDAAARAVARDVVDECVAAKPDPLPSWVPIALMRLDLPERALEMMRLAPSDNAGMFFRLWSPLGRDIRRLPEFAEFVRTAGLAEAWDRHGPPDRCRKDNSGDYVCD